MPPLTAALSPCPTAASSGVRQSPGGFIAAGSPGVVMRVRESSLSKQQILALAPNQTTPVTTVPGVPGVVRAEMLSDKRTVLTRDSDGVVSLWDLANSSVAEMFGKVDFEEKKKELQKARGRCFGVPPLRASTDSDLVGTELGRASGWLSRSGILRSAHALHCVLRSWRCPPGACWTSAWAISASISSLIQPSLQRCARLPISAAVRQ